MSSAHPGRRRILKLGLAGGALLAGAGLIHRATRKPPAAASPLVLEGEARALIAALLPAMLAGVAPERLAADADTTVAGVQTAIGGLSAASQQEVGDLIALLTLAPSRILVAGVSSPWSEASRDDVAAFLAGWRFSRFALLQQGYAALHDLVLGVWYGDSSHWQAIAYPGPPEVA